MKIIGHYRNLMGYPNLWGKIACYGKRRHKRLGFQVLVKSFDDYAWINIPSHLFENAAWNNSP